MLTAPGSGRDLGVVTTTQGGSVITSARRPTSQIWPDPGDPYLTPLLNTPLSRRANTVLFAPD